MVLSGLNGALNGPIVTIAALVLFSLVDLRVSDGPQGLWWTSGSLMDLSVSDGPQVSDSLA